MRILFSDFIEVYNALFTFSLMLSSGLFRTLSGSVHMFRLLLSGSCCLYMAPLNYIASFTHFYLHLVHIFPVISASTLNSLIYFYYKTKCVWCLRMCEF